MCMHLYSTLCKVYSSTVQCTVHPVSFFTHWHVRTLVQCMHLYCTLCKVYYCTAWCLHPVSFLYSLPVLQSCTSQFLYCTFITVSWYDWSGTTQQIFVRLNRLVTNVNSPSNNCYCSSNSQGLLKDHNKSQNTEKKLHSREHIPYCTTEFYSSTVYVPRNLNIQYNHKWLGSKFYSSTVQQKLNLQYNHKWLGYEFSSSTVQYVPQNSVYVPQNLNIQYYHKWLGSKFYSSTYSTTKFKFTTTKIKLQYNHKCLGYEFTVRTTKWLGAREYKI